MHISCCVFVNHICIFFYQGFLSQTLMTHRTAGERRWPSFILTNIQAFICNFACEIAITYFWSQRLCLPDCYSMRFTNLSSYHLIDWLMMWLLVDVILGFFYSLLDTGKAMGSNLHRHITLVLQANRLTKCTSHPKWDMEQMKYEAHHKNDKQQMK